MVGMKSYGRAPTFLLRTGYEQVRSVVAALAGDWEAARRVELVLPETGVCNLTPAHTGGRRPAAACCGAGSPATASAPRREHRRDARWTVGAATTVAPAAAARLARLRTRGWAITAALSVTETVSWGILYYAFAVFLVPMQRDLGFSAAQLTGAFSLALLVSAVAGVAVGRHLDRRSPRPLMTARLGRGRAAGARLVAGAGPRSRFYVGLGRRSAW